MAYELPNPEDKLPGPDEKFPERGTYYFTADQMLDMDNVINGIKMTHRIKKLGKSELVRAALHFVTEDFNLNGKDSWIARRMVAEAAVTSK